MNRLTAATVTVMAVRDGVKGFSSPGQCSTLAAATRSACSRTTSEVVVGVVVCELRNQTAENRPCVSSQRSTVAAAGPGDGMRNAAMSTGAAIASSIADPHQVIGTAPRRVCRLAHIASTQAASIRPRLLRSIRPCTHNWRCAFRRILRVAWYGMVNR